MNMTLQKFCPLFLGTLLSVCYYGNEVVVDAFLQLQQRVTLLPLQHQPQTQQSPRLLERRTKGQQRRHRCNFLRESNLKGAEDVVGLDEKAQEADDAIQQHPTSSSFRSEPPWLLQHGLLISSFSDGVMASPAARAWLKVALMRAMLKQEQGTAEECLERSVLFSPCAGPDIESLNQLETIDGVLDALENSSTARGADKYGADDSSADDNVLVEKALEVLPYNATFRFAYLPTAMYALNPDSSNTPGKQRQRARADGKKRRNRIVSVLREILPQQLPIQAVTIDFDDGSVKQPEYTSSSSSGEAAGGRTAFPATAMEAIGAWKPHLIYVQGGNSFWLHRCTEKGEQRSYHDAISSLASSGQCLYVGQSAGAILAGARMATACWKGWDDPRVVPERHTYEEWKDVAGLSLVGRYSFFPHMDDTWEGTVEEKQKADEIDQLITISDDEVYIVDGESRTLRRIDADEQHPEQ